jgi:hypothetical protein
MSRRHRPTARRVAAIVGLVARGARRKLATLRARPHATVVVRGGWQWAAAEGPVELAGPDAGSHRSGRDVGLRCQSVNSLQLGIIPAKALHEVWPIHGFWIFDQRMVRIETYAAELTVTHPREIGLYEKAFDGLARSAIYGKAARTLITQALNDLSRNPA